MDRLQTFIKVKFTSPLAPPPFLVSETAKWWADEELEAVQVGLAQVGSIAAPYYAGKLPLSNWSYAVPFGPGDPQLILQAIRRLYDKVPELQAELEKYNQRMLIPLVIATYNLTSKNPIITFEDFKDLKIASIGAYYPKILSVAGASAIHMPVAERYTALQLGVIMVRYLEWLEELGHTFPRKWAAHYR